MLNFDEALFRILKQVSPLRSERTGVGAPCLGRSLAEPVIAQLTQPPFNASAMDGYAVRSADVMVGKHLEIIGESQAGAGFRGAVAKGQCVRIFTGAPVPAETDAIIVQEQAERQDNLVSFSILPHTGQNIRPTGQDFTKGKELLGVGQALTPAAIALTAAANNASVMTYRRPKLAMLATGDELVPAGSNLQTGQIVASNSCGLSALFAPYCAGVTDLGIAADQIEALTQSLKAALESDADVIITSGGASVGDHDLVQPVFRQLGVDMGFWKIAMRPGKPLMFGTFGEKLIFGLPGNPVSAMITASLLVIPALKAMAGNGMPFHRMLRVPLAAPLAANGARRHFIRAHLVATDGATKALPFSQTDSAHLSSLATAQALIIHPENCVALEAGAHVDILSLPF